MAHFEDNGLGARPLRRHRTMPARLESASSSTMSPPPIVFFQPTSTAQTHSTLRPMPPTRPTSTHMSVSPPPPAQSSPMMSIPQGAGLNSRGHVYYPVLYPPHVSYMTGYTPNMSAHSYQLYPSEHTETLPPSSFYSHGRGDFYSTRSEDWSDNSSWEPSRVRPDAASSSRDRPQPAKSILVNRRQPRKTPRPPPTFRSPSPSPPRSERRQSQFPSRPSSPELSAPEGNRENQSTQSIEEEEDSEENDERISARTSRSSSRRPSVAFNDNYDILEDGHIYRRTEFDIDDGMYDIDDTSAMYIFTPSHMSHTSSTQTSSQDGDELSETGRRDACNSGGTGGIDHIHPFQSHLPTLSHVFSSDYSGDYTLGGSHGVNLTVVASNRMKHIPLFRWRHCTRISMDFDDFSTEATHTPNLTAVELKGIRDVLSRVQRKHVKYIKTANGLNVRHMEPACIQHTLPRDGSSYTGRTVTWICLPYFSLEQYSGLQGGPAGSSVFPIETLLQAKFSRTGRERDMLQAICRNKDARRGQCFHVAQIWCLVVDDSFLFTYGRMAEKELCVGSIGMIIKSAQEIVDEQHQTFITVAHKKSIKWSLRVEECRSWLDFLSHFREFWPQQLLFFRGKRPITAHDWPRVWNIAKHANDKLALEMRIGQSAISLPVGILLPKEDGFMSKEKSNPSNEHPASKYATEQNYDTPENPLSPSISIFSCLLGVIHVESQKIDEDVLDDHLREVEDYLLSKTRFSDRRAYENCPEATQEQIYSDLEKAAADMSKFNSHHRAQQQAYEMQVDIYNAAAVIFRFFFPPGVEVPTIRKFWGAIQIIISSCQPSVSVTGMQTRSQIARYNIQHIRYELRVLCAAIQAFNEIFGHATPLEQTKIFVPKEIVGGWMHLLMGLILMPEDIERSDRLVDHAKNLVRNGMSDMVRSLSETPLLESSVVLPLELMSLIGLKLMQDSTVGMPGINDCYSSCLHELESDIASKASDRSREYHINLLQEEIIAIKRVVNMQLEIFRDLSEFEMDANRAERPRAVFNPPHLASNALTSSIPYHDRMRVPSDARPAYLDRLQSRSNPASVFRGQPHSEYEPMTVYDDLAPATFVAVDAPNFRLASTDTGGYRMLLLNECVQFLTGREHEFSGFRDWAEFLEKVNQQKIDTTKDRHENAIYAFTIVTIIFLPLSFVASVFGMNTNDVRNMELNQWAYWATAVPVTMIIIFLGLLWTGELGNMIQWTQSFGRQHKGYRILPGGLSYDNYKNGTGIQTRPICRRHDTEDYYSRDQIEDFP